MAWSYNHKTGTTFWTEDPKYIPVTDPRMGEEFKDSGYGFRDTIVTRKRTEYATPKEAQDAREEYLKDQQIARNKAEAEQRAYDESINWAKSNLTNEEKELKEKINAWKDYVKVTTDKDIRERYQHQLDLLRQKLDTSISKRAFKYRKGN